MPTGCVPPCWIRATGTLNCTDITSSRWTPSLLLRWHSPSTQVQRMFVYGHACRIHRSFSCFWVVCYRWMLFDMMGGFFCIPLREDPVWPWCLHHAWLPEWASAAEEAGLTGLPKVSVWITLTDSAVYQEKNKGQTMLYLYFIEMEHYLIHFFFFFFFTINPFPSELLNCFSPCPQKKSWRLLWATMGVLCGNNLLSHYPVL